MRQRGKKKFAMPSQRGLYKLIRFGYNPPIVCFYIGSPLLLLLRLHPTPAVRVQGFQQRMGKGFSKGGETRCNRDTS
jgi:hypothetical protein